LYLLENEKLAHDLFALLIESQPDDPKVLREFAGFFF
jgi:hypothetical protein